MRPQVRPLSLGPSWSANFDDTASNAVSSKLSGLFRLGNFFIFPLMTNAIFERLTGPEPQFEGISRFIYVLLNTGGETRESKLNRQQNIKSARPGLLRNRKFRPFLHFEEVSNWRTTKSNRCSRICRTLGWRITIRLCAANMSGVMGVITLLTVSSVGTATANAWELKWGR